MLKTIAGESLPLRNASLILFAFLTLFLAGCSKKTESSQQNTVPNRIVSLSPASTEILFSVNAGSKVVAVSQYTDYPPEAKKLPVVGSFDGQGLSIEAILSYSPDFVYLTSGMHDFLIPSLEKYKIKYYVSNCKSVEGIINEISEIAKITGNENSGKKIVSDINQFLSMNSSNKSFHEIKTVYWEVWNSPYMTAGESSFINDLISKSGGKNLFSDLQEAYPTVSEESIIKRNPDVILIPASSGITVESVKHRKGWSKISAVQKNQIYIIDDNIYTRAGPRIIQVITDLSNILY